MLNKLSISENKLVKIKQDKMPHQCVHCGNIFPDAAEEVLKGCTCGSHFFLLY